MSKQKYYVVWKGRKTGIFKSWAEGEAQVKGFVSAEYKAFGSLQEAETALRSRYEAYKGKASSQGKWKESNAKPILPSIAVDAACNGSPGVLEFRGVDLESGREIFRSGPYADGTNNVGEFLAIVQALQWMKKNKKEMVVYSDSEIGIGWVFQGKCKTNLKHTVKNGIIFDMIRDAEKWLADHNPDEGVILKWDTHLWGENPADFGRK